MERGEYEAEVDPLRVRELLRIRACPWPAPTYRASTGSTNADALAALAAQGSQGTGVPDGSCFVAGEQTAGRGRHGRNWVSHPGAGLWSSTVLQAVPAPSRIPLLAALAVLDIAREMSGLELSIKWPNDVLAPGGRKLAGILAEAAPPAVVVGIGINVDYAADDLPDPNATSWFVESGEHPDRDQLLAGLLASMYRRLRQDWGAALADYRAACRTLGASIRVVLPSGEEFSGTGIDVDDSGHLLVRTDGTVRTVIAGDVLHATIRE